jgi:phosphatidylserine decarboxylase
MKFAQCTTNDSFVQGLPQGAPFPEGPDGPHVPSVQAFGDAINADPVMKDLFDKIFLQVSPLNRVCNVR